MLASRKAQSALACLSVIVFAAIPMNALAQSLSEGVYARSEEKEKISSRTDKSKKQCQSIDKILERVQEQLAKRQDEVKTKRAAVAAKFTARQQSHKAELDAKRASWDTRRQENFDKLLSKANTDEQKEAVELYIVAITKAVAEKRSANDSAQEVFINELKALKATLSQSISSNVSEASASIKQAIANAKSACESGESFENVKKELKSELEKVREQSKSERQSVGKSEQLKAIIKNRNEAVRANIAIFKDATKTARQTLKTALDS